MILDEDRLMWESCFTEGLIFLTYTNEIASLKYMPRGYASGKEYIVVSASGPTQGSVVFTDDIDDAVLLKMRFGGRIMRNPERIAETVSSK